MRLHGFSLRAGIVAQLSILILAAMLLCDLVMVQFAARDLIRAKAEAGRLLAGSLQTILDAVYQESGDGGGFDGLESGIEELLRTAGYEGCVLIDPDGRRMLTLGKPGPPAADPVRCATEALHTGGESVQFVGRTWAVVWTGPEYVQVSAPVKAEGRVIGGLSAYAPLAPVYARLRGSQKAMVFYILLDTAVLALAGLYLLSRSVVAPIKRLVRKTREYQGGEFALPQEAESAGEIAQLSHSIRGMLERLERNKQTLEENIASLEQANKELVRAREETVRSEKLASVGRLAAGIAHEVGNPLGIILGYLELARNPDLGPQERADLLERAESEAARINSTIRNLLDFSRASEGPEEDLSVHDIITELAEMLQLQPDFKGKRIALSLNAGCDRVVGERNRVRQVFLNLMMNAADAVTESEAESLGEEALISIETRTNGEWIEAAVSDTGPGIPYESTDKVFDPFYTTKDPGKGTGLGLSVSHGIVEDMGGEMRIHSEPGRGTSVLVRLPVHEEGNSET